MDTSTDVRAETCEIVVLGAGMAGLMAATTLSDRDVVVLEGAPRAGGRVESVRRGDYWINLGTQFTEGTGPLIEALKRHEITMGTLAGKTVAVALDGKQVDTSNGIVRRHPRVVPFWRPGDRPLQRPGQRKSAQCPKRFDARDLSRGAEFSGPSRCRGTVENSNLI